MLPCRLGCADLKGQAAHWLGWLLSFEGPLCVFPWAGVRTMYLTASNR